MDAATDWLTLNVCTPDPGRTGLPVLVWLCCGGYMAGTAADPMVDPQPWPTPASAEPGQSPLFSRSPAPARCINGRSPTRFPECTARLHWPKK
jgi:hypothetical protein